MAPSVSSEKNRAVAVAAWRVRIIQTATAPASGSHRLSESSGGAEASGI